MARVEKVARELGIELVQDALEALEDLAPADARSLLEQVASKGDSIRNPSAYVIRTIEHGYDPGKGGEPSGKGGGGGGKGGGGKRSYSGGGGGGGGGSRKSAARASELGIDLDDTALEALSGVPLGEALQLLDDIAAKGTGKGGGIRNPSGYVASACAKINASAEAMPPLQLTPPSFAVGGGKGGRKGGGGKSAARAAELGLDLDDSALEALANVPLTEAIHLIEDVASKGVGKGGIRNPSGYIATACGKINDAAAWAAETISKTKGGAGCKGGGLSRGPIGSLPSGPGGRSAARAAELGIELSEPALEALSTIPLRDAYELLDSLAGKGLPGGKGGVRNPSGWVVTAVSKMGVADQLVPPSSVGKGAPHYQDNGRGGKGGGGGGGKGGIEDRIMNLNRSGLWNGEKIDVEALMALKRLPSWQAHELLDACEAKGAGKGGIKNPSNYIGAAVVRIGAGGGGGGGGGAPLEAPRKRPRQEYEARSAGHGPVAQKAKELRLELDLEALDRLAAQPVGDAMELLEQVSANFDKIKNPSKYISAACDRGIEKEASRPPAKRPRPSSAAD